MKIKEIGKIKGLRIHTEEIEVDATSVIEHAFFEDRNCSNYRKDSIEYMVKNKIDFHSTTNSSHEMFKKFVKVECPQCHKDMTLNSGGGNGSASTALYVCNKCGINTSITIPCEGINVNWSRRNFTY